ncbi:MFS family permease [Rhodoligotrophos appendicifer]|uniref:MFS transporter n=1 Tax=Rhodoligotrophos appendicifer TaxID=987056 RepID=UPI001186CD6F|nr:MFS transporter [Rhodoligotrophos appendicifer]
MSAGASRWVVISVLAATTAMQALAANSLFMIPTIAPRIAEAVGVPTSLVGFQVSLVYLGAMLMSVMAGSLSTLWGPIRASQVSLALGVAGLALATLAWLPGLILASFIIGLGYGLINPPSGDLLNRVSSPKQRSLLFSVKQTAVPLGGILAGLVGPPVALRFGWMAALWVSAGLSIAAIVIMQAFSSRFASEADRSVRLRDNPFRDIALVWSTGVLRWITLSGFCFAAVQFTLTTYLVTLLVEDVRMGLVAAGVGFSIFQFSAVIGRLSWGFLAGVTRSSLNVLLAAFCMSLLAILPLIFMTAQWSIALIYVCLAVLGASGAAWNGVFVSEIVTLAPPESAARAIGGAFAFTFAGALIGPSSFAVVHGWLGLYTHTTGLIALFAVLGCLCAMMAAAARRQHNRSHSPQKLA